VARFSHVPADSWRDIEVISKVLRERVRRFVQDEPSAEVSQYNRSTPDICLNLHQRWSTAL